MSEWSDINSGHPEHGQRVLAYYRNSLGIGRIIRAEYIEAGKREADFADPDTQCVEYDEENDCFYLEAGWYELIDNWDEYSSIAVTVGDVTHWMPLPEPPK